MMKHIAIIVSLMTLVACASKPPPRPSQPVIKPNIIMQEAIERPDQVSKEILYKHFGKEWVDKPYFVTSDHKRWRRPVPYYDIKVGVNTNYIYTNEDVHRANRCLYLHSISICGNCSEMEKCARSASERDRIIEALIGLGARY